MKNSIGLENERLITKDNVQQLGEILAVSAVKKMVNFKPIYARLYRELVHNVFDPLQDNERFGEGYELVQEICCFLCNFIGKRLGDTYKTDKRGKTISIRKACYRLVDNYITKNYIREREYYRVISIEELSRTQELAAKEITPMQTDYTGADRILRKLKLTKKENDVLNCYLAGMAYTEIARFLCVNASTIWRRKMKIQQKYAQNFGAYI
ncbi:MAG: hypothetical protein SPH68_03210 [Candidatus Borkfalkiaceae bacterium]|nr:hypothetical protein [Clostridia bacterium]MDY6223153.1 hypothetical protein [Christensenellaceae bacterium]